MPPVGFEPTIPAGERPQTYALDRAATGTGLFAFEAHFMERAAFILLFASLIWLSFIMGKKKKI